MLAGIGVAVSRLLAPGERASPWTAAPWLGLVAILAYLQVWNVFAPVGWAAWALPLAASATGAVLVARRRRRPGRPAPRALAAGGLAAVAVLWVANHALEPATDYDLGLYHLGLIEYAKRYATVAGLANLQTRFGASDPHLLLVSLLDRGPWAGGAWHLVDGLLVSLLLLEVAARLAVPGRGPSFTRRLAALLVPATAVVVGVTISYRLSSPNLDLACFVLVAVGMLYLADCVENGLRAVPAATALAALAAASATRPLFWLTTLFAGAVLGRQVVRARGVSLVRLAALPVLLLAGWLVRQAILSGYPFFPATFLGLPVDWRVPASVVHYNNRWTSSWARWPGHTPAEVLSSWHWLRAFWLPVQEQSLDVIAPLALLGCLVPAAMLGRADSGRAARTRPMLAVVTPSAASLVIWFLEAPDPRFVLAPLWLLPSALVAWALPPMGRRAPIVVGVAAAAAAGLAALDVTRPKWFLPGSLLLPVYLLGLLWVVRRTRWIAPLATAMLLGAAAAGVGVVVWGQRAHPLVTANASGPFGVPEEEVPPTAAVKTAGGLWLRVPVSARTGNDQCYAVLRCTAAVVDPSLHDVLERLHLRGSGTGSGFSVRTTRAGAFRPCATRHMMRAAGEPGSQKKQCVRS